MDKVQYENFYKILRQFLLNLRESFPEKTDEINEYYKYVRNTKKSKYVKSFMKKLEEYSKSISHCDKSIFETDEPVYLLKNIDFRPFFNESVSEKSQTSIWHYLQSLFILGNFITNTNNEIMNTLKKISIDENGDNENTENKNYNVSEEITEQAKVLKDMIDNMKNAHTEQHKNDDSESNSQEESSSNQNQDSNDSSNPLGLIESLAKEIAEEIELPKDIKSDNPADLFHSMFFSKQGGFAKLLSSVGEKIKNKVDSGQLNEEILMKETQKMMGNMQGMMKNMGGKDGNPQNMPDMGKIFQQMMGGGNGMPNMGGLGNILGAFMNNRGDGNDGDGDEEFPDFEDIQKKIQKNRNSEFRAAMKREQLRRKLENRKKLLNKNENNNSDVKDI